METFMTQTTKLFASEAYLQRISELTKSPVARVRQAHHLLTNLVTACLLKQLSTDIGRNLFYNTTLKRAIELESGHQTQTHDLMAIADRGDKWFNNVVPGKKSAVIRITAQYTKLPFASIDPVMGLVADAFLNEIYFSIKQNAMTASTLHKAFPAPTELQKLAPELASKDYETIGVRSLMLQA
ncbi:hypothetical protein [Arsenicibacter rosenii]|uniref:Uncharacterized protein n=1 Tax=Arsenicibacter rosenii TaxID=1750698 RepID=A0A1S2VNK7_9BACT|nr:hypothetical protein [Arsenicibacter rosenii]OIN60361.1 hypothetical protein BLX24_05920 [Arsenicibacter rosenii]